jgi:putative transposase
VIAQQADHFAVADLCRALGVSRSGYYAWRNRMAGADGLTPQVAQVFWRHSRRYGARRIVAELQAQGCQIGRRRVSRILREQQLQAIQPKRFVPKTTDSRHGHRMSPNLLGGLEISRPRQVFVSDITYLPLHSGEWAYLATWLDLYSRKIVGWQVAAQMTAELVIGALRQAIVRECPPRGLIVHSDRGGQYVDAEFRRLLEANGYEQSMSRAGETYDNAFAESLFSRYKAELLEGGAFRDVAEAQGETFDYIEAYYNRVRRHSALGYVSPAEFERAYFQRTSDELLTDQERT